MRISKTSQLAAGFLLAAVFVSFSSAACTACARHHRGKAENHSCRPDPDADQSLRSEKARSFGQSDGFCDCLKEASPLVSNKPENKKTQQSSAALPGKRKAEIRFEVSTQRREKSFTSYSFYNSNHPAKLIPPRAPPAL